MMESKSVAILLRPDIRTIDFDCTAGTERVAIEDLQLLKKYMGSIVFCSSAQLSHWPTDLPVRRLLYPNRLIDIINKFSCSRRRWVRRIFSILYFLTTRVFEIGYVLQFLALNGRFDYYYVFQVPLVGILMPQKAVVMCQDLSPRTFYFSRLVPNRIDKALFVFCSRSLRERFAQMFPNVSKRRLHVLYNSVDTHMFIPKRRPSLHNPIHFGYVGTWSKEKGIGLLVDVIDKINSNKRLRDVSFTIVGGDIWDQADWERKRLQGLWDKIEGLKQYANVQILGKLPYQKLPALYRSLDYLLFPSLWKEPFGNVMIEAMACGTPVVAFRAGVTREVVSSGRDGILIHGKKADALAQVIERLRRIHSLKRHAVMSRSARQKTIKHFSRKARLARLNGLLLMISEAEN